MALGTPGTASKVLEIPGTTSGTPGVALGTPGTTLKRPGTGQQHWEPPEGHREPPQRPWEHQERPQGHRERPRGHREHRHSPVPVVLLEHREGFKGILELEETKERPRASGAVAGFSPIPGFFLPFFLFSTLTLLAASTLAQTAAMAARSSSRRCFFSLALLDFLWGGKNAPKSREFAPNLSDSNRCQSPAPPTIPKVSPPKFTLIKRHRCEVIGEQRGVVPNSLG